MQSFLQNVFPTNHEIKPENFLVWTFGHCLPNTFHNLAFIAFNHCLDTPTPRHLLYLLNCLQICLTGKGGGVHFPIPDLFCRR